MFPIRNFRVRFPTPLFVLVTLVSLIGVMNIASAARAIRPDLYLYQLLWLSIGIGACTFVVLLPTRTLGLVAYPFYAFVCGLLLVVLVVGPVVKGSQRWIDFGFFRMQPSELAKLCVVLAIARYCSDFQVAKGYRLWDLLRPLNISRPLGVLAVAVFLCVSKKGRELIPWLNEPASWQMIVCLTVLALVLLLWVSLSLWQFRREGLRFYQFVALSDLLLLPVLLILVEPDLGTAMIVLAVSGSIVLFAGMRPISLAIAFAGAICMAIFAWNVVLHDYQKERIETFLNPEADLRGQGYHAAQSMIAIGSGQFSGKGFGEGTQTQLSFLPENHTDFAFAVLAEEWGFLGALTLMILFLSIVVGMLYIGMKAQDRFSALLVVGAVAVVFWHVFINVGMVIGILPVVGVTLPFVSYGGASLIVQFSALAICINVAVWRRIK